MTAVYFELGWRAFALVALLLVYLSVVEVRRGGQAVAQAKEADVDLELARQRGDADSR